MRTAASGADEPRTARILSRRRAGRVSQTLMRALLEPAAVSWWRLRAALSRSAVVDRPFQYGSSRRLFERLA